MDQSKILIVEDEVIVGMDLRKKLEKLGFTVDPAVITYGEDVLVAAEKGKPDLILMDIKLKGEMDGARAASMVREKLGLPVVFLTAYSDETTLSRAKRAEPHAYLKKPVRIEDLRISLEIALHKAEMEKKLKESELRFRTVADFTHDWETWIGADGEYVYTSPSCRRVTGWPPEKFLEDSRFFIGIVHPDERETVRKQFAEHDAPGEKDCRLEFRIMRSDGEIRWIEHISQPVYASDGAYIGRRASNRDVTERKELEFSLERKVAELREALENIKTLKGLIPICSNCKKIRDDKGYWNILEAYIQKHSQAQFSHGMCPACMDEFYGKEDWYQKPGGNS